MMKPYRPILFVILVLALVQMACSLPSTGNRGETPTVLDLTPTTPPLVTATNSAAAPTATNPAPVVITATPNAAQPTATTAPAQPTATRAGNTNTNSGQSCTYRATFVADVTIPDDSFLSPGASFTKTWRVRNDGTCAWGPNNPLHALAFTGGSKLGAVDQISLAGTVQSGQMIDVSVNMVAPNTAGTYISEWKFRVDGASGGVGPFVGLGASQSEPLFTRIIVGPTPTPKPPTATPIASTRVTFASGATTTTMEGQVNASAVKSYVLTAGKGQLLMVNFSSAAADLRMRIVDAKSQTVLVAPTSTTAQTVLPANGDYLIQMVGGSQNANFTMGVTIPSRITFDSGDTAATVDGKITNRLPVTYLLRAMKDQTMTVTVTSASSGLALTIYGLDDGNPLVRSQSGLTTWTGKLPATQDYVIIVMPSVDSAAFTLQTAVQ